MRTLNRPMFRYGGPIKEGVMSGIKEPRQNYQWGSAVMKQVGTKVPALGAHYSKGIANLGKLWNKIKGWTGTPAQAPYSKVVSKQSPGGKMLNLKPRFRPGGTGPNPADIGKVWTPHGWVARDPLYKLGSAAWQGKGYIGKPLKWAGKTIATPTGGIGLVYLGGKWLTRDGKPANENEINEHLNKGGNTGGPQHPSNNPDLYGGLKTAEDAAAAEKARKAQIQKYRDIMDIKGMNSEAASKSLIEASRLINESQDFKGDIRSGSLINKIIQGASKAYDKPADMRRAIDTLIVKGEIEKDLNKDKNAILDTYRMKQIENLDRAAAQDSLQGDIRTYVTKQGALPSGNMLANFARGRGWNITGVEDTTEVKKWMNNNDGKNEIDYLTWVMSEGEIGPGVYVINNRILEVDEQKKITPKF
jgi:hypothetical protein